MRVHLVVPTLSFLLATTLTAATYTVSSPDDSGPGTLRQAILDANAHAGADQIVFTTTVVNATASLPFITDTVAIDGTVGASRVTVNGLFFDGSRAFTFDAGSSNSSLTNVTVHDFAISAAVITADHVTLTRSTLPNEVDISGDFTTIGSTTAGSGINLLGGGLHVTSENNTVLRSSTGLLQLLFADNNQIGTTGNGNTINFLSMQSSGGNVVEGNTIHRVQISNALPPSNGGTLRNNTISNGNTAAGIEISSGGGGADPATGFTITGNSIYDVTIPIDLGFDGPTPNDAAPDADPGANNLQNFPVLTSASLAPHALTVNGTLTSAPLTTYRIELFGNPAADPEARNYLGAFDVTTDAAGNASFTNVSNTPLPASGDVITSTATNIVTGDTSEVSAAVTPTVVAAAAEPIPTLSQWSLLSLALGLGILTLLRLRQA